MYVRPSFRLSVHSSVRPSVRYAFSFSAVSARFGAPRGQYWLLFPVISETLFLGAAKHLYKRVCPSVRRSVTPSHFRQFRRASGHRVASIGSCFLSL